MQRFIIPVLLVVGLAIVGCGSDKTTTNPASPATGTVATSTTTSTSPHLKYCGALPPGDHGLTPCTTTAKSSGSAEDGDAPTSSGG